VAGFFMRGRMGGMKRKLPSREALKFIYTLIVINLVTAAVMIGELKKNPPESLWERIGLGLFLGVWFVSLGIILRNRYQKRGREN